jgi:hypothetical protein
MANSYVEYSSGLTATTYNIPFNYISIDDVLVKGYNGSSWSDLTVASRDATAKTVTLDAAPSALQKIRVYRSTSTAQLVDFQNGSRLSERDLDTAYQQGLFVAQEVSENASTEVEGIGPQGPQGIAGNDGIDGTNGTDGVDGDSPFKDNFYHVVHNTTSDGGTFTSGAWQVRQLNSERSTQTWASVSGDVVTLDAGTYHVEASAPAFRCNSHVTRITVDDVEVLRGTAEYSNNADPTSQTRSFVSGRVTLASQLGLKLEHRCIATQSNNGLGIAHGIGDTVFADVKIYKLS